MQQYGDWYRLLAVDGWVVTVCTARRVLGRLRLRLVPSSLHTKVSGASGPTLNFGIRSLGSTLKFGVPVGMILGLRVKICPLGGIWEEQPAPLFLFLDPLRIS